MFRRQYQRSPQYDLVVWNAKLDPKKLPILRQSGEILFDKIR